MSYVLYKHARAHTHVGQCAEASETLCIWLLEVGSKTIKCYLKNRGKSDPYRVECKFDNTVVYSNIVNKEFVK